MVSLAVVLASLLFYDIGRSSGERSALESLADGNKLESARAEVEHQYLGLSTTCGPQDNLTPEQRKTSFYEYLRVNRYANRALIRSCNDIDHLLAKTEKGAWEMTGVNVSLDQRAGPTWQTACLIDDITLTDNVSRPENNSIDKMNLEHCRYMARHNKLMPQTGF